MPTQEYRFLGPPSNLILRRATWVKPGPHWLRNSAAPSYRDIASKTGQTVLFQVRRTHDHPHPHSWYCRKPSSRLLQPLGATGRGTNDNCRVFQQTPTQPLADRSVRATLFHRGTLDSVLLFIRSETKIKQRSETNRPYGQFAAKHVSYSFLLSPQTALRAGGTGCTIAAV